MFEVFDISPTSALFLKNFLKKGYFWPFEKLKSSISAVFTF